MSDLATMIAIIVCKLHFLSEYLTYSHTAAKDPTRPKLDSFSSEPFHGGVIGRPKIKIIGR